MKKLILSLLVCVAACNAFAQQDQVLMTINGKEIMASEFLYIYEKNNQDNSIDKKSMEEYLDLFINFKLKVTDAIAHGMDTTAAFHQELAGYRAQAAEKYLKDEQAIDSLIQLSYYRMANPRRAAHIAIQCPANADEATVAEAERLINLARERVTTGVEKQVKKGRKTITVREKEDFYAVAREMTQDPAGKENGGELGWIQVFRFVYPFEDAVYNTPVGEVTPVFRSPYGLHIALVEEERPYEEVHAAHIMKMTSRGDEAATELAKAEIDSLYALVLAGANFEETALAASDDKGSATRGGDLGWFSRGMMVQPFEDITFAMQPGEMSEPFATRFGWHFVKLYERRGIQPLDSMRAQMYTKVKRDVRSKEADKSFIAKTRAEYNLPAEMSDADVRAYADAHLEEKYEEFAHLVREYHDGILLFEVSLQEVWDKASKDHEGLTAHFEANKKKFVWQEPLYKGYVIYAKDEVSAKAAKQIVKNADPDSIMSYLNKRVNIDSIQYVKVEKGLWMKGLNAAVDKYGFKSKTAEYTTNEDFPIVVMVGKVIKAPQEYADVRGDVITSYQDYLEKRWLEALKAKYEVVINQEVLDQLMQAADQQ